MNSLIAFCAEYKTLFVILHVFSVVIGMGAALVSDVLFNIFIKDKKLNITENGVLSTLSRIVWIALLFIVLSGAALFFSNPEVYAVSVKFLTKMSIVGVLILNGLFFHFVVHPALPHISFTDTKGHNKYIRIRRWSFAFGAVSVSSWVLAFILGSLSKIPFSYPQALALYAIVLACGIIVSQIVERRITSSKAR